MKKYRAKTPTYRTKVMVPEEREFREAISRATNEVFVDELETPATQEEHDETQNG